MESAYNALGWNDECVGKAQLVFLRSFVVGGFLLRSALFGTPMNTPSHTFRRFAILTICAVYALIAVGSIVRVTGAGMGCPDWPTCFGRLIPPTDISQLPADYKLRFAIAGKEIADFNVVHTWTEYTNRLIGVTIGLLILGTFLLSTRYWSMDRRITYNSLLAFLLVLFEGWLGAKVVEHNLRPLTVTLHFVLSLVIVIALTNAIVRAHRELWSGESIEPSANLNAWFLSAMGILLFQMVVGTQVRQQVDVVSRALNFANRDIWLPSVGFLFYFHRSFSILVLLIQFWMLRKLYLAARFNAKVVTWVMVIVALFGVEILSGIIMTYLEMPWFVQPTHVLLSALILGVEYMVYLRVRTLLRVQGVVTTPT